MERGDKLDQVASADQVDHPLFDRWEKEASRARFRRHQPSPVGCMDNYQMWPSRGGEGGSLLLTTTVIGAVKAAMSSDEMRSFRSGEALRCAVPQCLSSLINVVGGAPLADRHQE